jgi:predicted 2-oxoglutarate/Fe(II)-dependent dioxygenase YbiX
MHTSGNIVEQELMLKSLWHVINQYVTVEFSQFYEKFLWFDDWRGYTNIKFHKYDVNTDMKLHCDHIRDIFDGNRKGVPILTIVGLLNDDFEGGDFLLWEKEKIDLKQGSVLIFPSNFMYPHQVTSIIRGCRYSFVSWVW